MTSQTSIKLSAEYIFACTQMTQVNDKVVAPVNEREEASAETPVVKPKRKCTEKQLAALAAGRAKNPRFKSKQTSTADPKSE